MNFERYCRQINLIGKEQQEKIMNSSVLVVGAGGIGSPVLIYLAAAGVNKIGIIDHDKIELTNIHRQILFTENDIGLSKTIIAANKLRAVNSSITIKTYNFKLDIDNAIDILNQYDLIVDCTDNFKTGYLINDVCCKIQKPFFSTSIFQNLIYLIFFDIQNGCYRCAFPEPPPPNLIGNCSETGVLGSTVGIAGTMASQLVLQYFTHQLDLQRNKIITFNAESMCSNHYVFQKNPHCIACVNRHFSWPSISYNLNFSEINLAEFCIIDIREKNEDRYLQLSLNEHHFPFSELMNHKWELSNRKYLLYCQSGIRSDYASFWLRKQHIEAYSLAEGIKNVK